MAESGDSGLASRPKPPHSSEPDSSMTIIFHHPDGKLNVFHPTTSLEGKPRWHRAEANITLHWDERFGWIISDAQGTMVGRPWDVPREEQGDSPPIDAVWVSRKDSKAYVYSVSWEERDESSTAI